MESDADVIVIGSGAGGSAFASACAAAGKQVIVVERGKPVPAAKSMRNEQRMLIDKVPYDDRAVDLGQSSARLYMGGVLGGGTAVFGGAMLRPSSDDFHPGRYYSRHLSREQWDWPISYDQLSPFYDQAELLYRLAASAEESYGPLHPPTSNLTQEPIPLAAVNQRLIASNQDHGLRPFRLPLAIDGSLCDRCPRCAGYPCPTGARRSAEQILKETVERHRLRIVTNAEVEQIRIGPDAKVESVLVRDRDRDTLRPLRAKTFALAAGAIGSAAILLRSNIGGRHVGRNYMLHYSPIVVGIFPGKTGADADFVKQVGFADYYFGTSDVAEKMGLVQSLPAPGPLMLAKSGLRCCPKIVLDAARKRMLPLAGIVEDLPDAANRVTIGRGGTISLSHRFTAFDQHRGRELGARMREILRRAGAVYCSVRNFPSREHVAHQCGTLRFGSDRKHAVVDPDCRSFDHPNLFVVDGSVLPTSLGVGPSLTIVANALRVARTALATL